MIPAGLKVGDTFKEGYGIYEIIEVIPSGYPAEYVSKRIKIDLDSDYADEVIVLKSALVKKEEIKAEPKKDAPAKLDSFNKYTKTEINRLNNAELEKVCDKLGLEKSTGMAMKKAIIEKLGL